MADGRWTRQNWTSSDGFDLDLLKVIVAEDGAWAGYVWGWAAPDDDERAGFIGDLGLRAAYRGRGLGRWLLRRSMADLGVFQMSWGPRSVAPCGRFFGSQRAQGPTLQPK